MVDSERFTKKVVLGFFFCVILIPWAQGTNGGAPTDSKYALSADFVHFVQLFIKRCRACEVFHHFLWNTKATDPLLYWDPKWCFKHLFSFWFAVDVTEVWFWCMLRGSPLLSLPYSLSLSVSVSSTSNLVRRRDSEHHWFNHWAPTNLVLRHSYSLFLTTTRVFVNFQIRFADSRVSCGIWLYQVWKWWDGKSAVGYVHIFALLCLLFSVIPRICVLCRSLLCKKTRPTWSWYFPELSGF